MKRRQIVQGIGAGVIAATFGYPAIARNVQAKVVVIGGGFGGATAARYLRIGSNKSIDVTLVEPHPALISCPMANLVIGGEWNMADITLGYKNLIHRHGVKVIADLAQSIDADKRIVKLSNGFALAYDRLIVSPGIDFMWEELPGLRSVDARRRVLHGWQGGDQFFLLRQQIAAMPDGGTFAISIPLAPLRCPPAPYERACLVADYFRRVKSKSKVLILDDNDDVLSEARLFKRMWKERYAGIIEYRSNFSLADVDFQSNTIFSNFGDRVQASVLNVIPPQRAGNIAFRSGLVNVNKRWCEVNFLDFESTQAPRIHVLGDAIQTAPLMAKSAAMANQQAKVCAMAVIDSLHDKPLADNAILLNTCYSFVSSGKAMHVRSTHRYDKEQKTFLIVPAASGVSTVADTSDAKGAVEWAHRIWADSLGGEL